MTPTFNTRNKNDIIDMAIVAPFVAVKTAKHGVMIDGYTENRLYTTHKLSERQKERYRDAFIKVKAKKPHWFK